MARILVVDDERSMQEFLEILLRRDGHDVVVCGSASEATVALESDDFDLVLSDIRMPGMSGIELLDHVKSTSPETLVVLITAHGTTESAVEAMKAGAHDYLTKPCSVDEIRLVVQKAVEKRDLSHENQVLRRQIQDRAIPATVMGRSPQMAEVFDLVRQVAPARTNVLVSGESGTGKELVARALHSLSDRRGRAFVAVNCGAIPENLLESELFGHVKGAFTGAVTDKMGLFEVADGGTLFLDEIGEMPFALQVKVLRAIQSRTFKRVGGTKDVHVDVRIVAATNRKLDEEVRAGRFREDLYYRLNVIEIVLPPLRERPEDVPQLVQHFLRKFSAELGKETPEVDAAVLSRLEAYDYPGNVRELENILERAVTLSRNGRVELECLPSVVREGARKVVSGRLPEVSVDLDGLLADYERSLIGIALERTAGVKKHAARILGISFRSLRYRLEKLGLDSVGSDDPIDD